MLDKESLVGGRQAKITLILLVLVYVFNFIDRQILSVLAEDIKMDLNISDSDIGFLFGTAFAIFYSVFGIPLGKLSDVWSRRKIISLGLGTWSLMTALSGTARSFTSLAIFRFGVGIGESSASPATYSMLSDYFSPKVRSTVLAIYASGLYIGAGIGIFLGGWIVDLWNNAFPDISLAPFGLRGWQVAFMAVGIPGIILAFFTWQIKEPPRGLSENISSPESLSPFREMLKEFIGITPFGLLASPNLIKEILVNLFIGLTIFYSMFALIIFTGDRVQWIAFGIGLYLLSCWIQGMKHRDLGVYQIIFKSKALIASSIGFGSIAFVTYSISAWVPSFYIRNHGISEAEAGTVLGLTAAIGGIIGTISGGILGDLLKRNYPNGRLYIGYIVVILTIPLCLGLLYAENLYVSYICNFLFHIVTPLWVGIGPATVSDLVLPRMRALAGAFYLLIVSMIGLALGPYSVGFISNTLQDQGMNDGESLKFALASSLVILVITIIALSFAGKYLAKEERSLLSKAKSLGEIF
ncbi:MAG: MFS transporter [SAR86 cluster bacterium]|jgi:MFS family permease|nr:MFS transporter [SAR86 cluster bacterium]